VLRHGLEALREATGEEAFMLGCGCPLGPAIGLVDAMRINADVARRWKPSFNGIEFFFEAEPNFPSARNATHNSLTRAALHRRWWINDPDCLLLRPETHLTLDEVRSLATVIAMTGGSLLLSDHLPALPPERLRIAQALLPPIGQRPSVPDWLDAATPTRLRLDLESESGSWRLLALFNWADQPREMTLRLAEYQLDEGEYWAREFWSGRVRRFSGDELALEALPAHGAALLAVRRSLPDQPQYLGSDLHVSQGLEATAWEWGGDALELRLRLERPGRAQGHIDLALPSPPKRATLEGAPLSWIELEEGCYRFTVEFEGSAQVRVIVGIS
jgi:alpha-galactosidase